MTSIHITIRPETPADFSEIRELVQNSFSTVEFSDHQEHHLIERLREDPAYIPKLALVAENADGKTIGHIMFSEAYIGKKNDKNKVLSLAPLSVHPNYQKMGVGTALIQHAHQIIKQLNYSAVIVLGYPEYYAKFGYQNAINLGITTAFDIPEGVLRVWQLKSLLPTGAIIYADAFGLNDI